MKTLFVDKSQIDFLRKSDRDSICAKLISYMWDINYLTLFKLVHASFNISRKEEVINNRELEPTIILFLLPSHHMSTNFFLSTPFVKYLLKPFSTYQRVTYPWKFYQGVLVFEFKFQDALLSIQTENLIALEHEARNCSQKFCPSRISWIASLKLESG